MNSQTQIAFKIFKESVGAPDWANTDGRESAIREWEESLGRYSDEQVKKACLKCIKYKMKSSLASCQSTAVITFNLRQ